MESGRRFTGPLWLVAPGGQGPRRPEDYAVTWAERPGGGKADEGVVLFTTAQAAAAFAERVGGSPGLVPVPTGDLHQILDLLNSLFLAGIVYLAIDPEPDRVKLVPVHSAADVFRRSIARWEEGDAGDP